MKRRSFLNMTTLLLSISRFSTSWGTANNLPPLNLDPYTEKRITTLTQLMPEKCGTPERLEAISAAFLDTPYKSNSLIGSENTFEKLVIDFREVDCLCFLEYITALNRSTSRTMFIHELIRTRYKNSVISFQTRRHFFSDWTNSTPILAQDVTKHLSSHAVTITKFLNCKDEKGSLWLPGISIEKRRISHIPASKITPYVLAGLLSGDLIGIYTEKRGLDVTHTGLAIRTGEGLMFRNASSLSKNRKVVDTPLLEYIHEKPGIVVLRSS